MLDQAASTLRMIDRISARDRLLIAAYRGQGEPMTSPPDKLAALVDTVRVLTALSAPHAVIGGVAVGIHAATPRATLDTNLALASTVERSAVLAALTAAGFTHSGEFEHSINFRHASGEPVQLAFDPAFDPMIGRAERFSIGEVASPIVTRADLIAMKERATADPARRPSKRQRDQADITLLRGGPEDPDAGW